VRRSCLRRYTVRSVFQKRTGRNCTFLLNLRQIQYSRRRKMLHDIFGFNARQGGQCDNWWCERDMMCSQSGAALYRSLHHPGTSDSKRFRKTKKRMVRCGSLAGYPRSRTEGNGPPHDRFYVPPVLALKFVCRVLILGNQTVQATFLLRWVSRLF